MTLETGRGLRASSVEGTSSKSGHEAERKKAADKSSAGLVTSRQRGKTKVRRVGQRFLVLVFLSFRDPRGRYERQIGTDASACRCVAHLSGWVGLVDPALRVYGHGHPRGSNLPNTVVSLHRRSGLAGSLGVLGLGSWVLGSRVSGLGSWGLGSAGGSRPRKVRRVSRYLLASCHGVAHAQEGITTVTLLRRDRSAHPDSPEAERTQDYTILTRT